MHRTTRRIGPIGTVTRLLAAAGLLYLAFFDGASWGLEWYDAAVGLGLLPAASIALGLGARRWASRPVRFTGSAGTTANCLLLVGLGVNPYTAGGAALFYGATLVVAAWRALPGCEGTVLSNWILGRDDQVGCPLFSPIDDAEARLYARRAARAGVRRGAVRTRGGISTDAIRNAYEALGARDVERLVALMHPTMEWRGRRTWRFWQQPPS